METPVKPMAERMNVRRPDFQKCEKGHSWQRACGTKSQFGITNNQSGRTFILSAMGLTDVPKKVHPEATNRFRGSEGRKRPRAGADCWRRLPAVCVCCGFLLRTNLFEKSFLQLFSQSTKKRTYSPCLKAKNFRFRNFFATCVVETNPNQNGRSTGRSKQSGLDRLLGRTARQADGQAARQDGRETPATSWKPNREKPPVCLWMRIFVGGAGG